MSKKPSAAAIRRSSPLGPDALRGSITHCNVCGEESWGDLMLWRAHDENDLPILTKDGLVYVDCSHAACEQKMNDHPRLFVEDGGAPGSWPTLCRDCIYRRGIECEHPKLMKNGGPGLAVQVDTGKGMFFCGDGGRHMPTPRAWHCEGRSHLRPVPDIAPVLRGSNV